jgi:hypothetical protein
MFVKNVNTLIVKVFEINTANYYRGANTEINTDINLDGLTPNWEYTYTYNEAPVRRVRRQFEFAELTRRGVYVIDFIGNGRSSRALIRKGKLRYVMRNSTAGLIFNVLDENNQRLTNTEIQLGGQRYTADKDGEIAVTEVSGRLAGCLNPVLNSRVPDPTLIAALDTSRDSYNVNGLGQIAAEATLDDLPYYRANFRRIRATRARLSDKLSKLGCRILPSQSNFILVHPPRLPAQQWLQELRRRQILVRWFSHPDVEGYLRITIGTDTEATALVRAIGQILARAGT